MKKNGIFGYKISSKHASIDWESGINDSNIIKLTLTQLKNKEFRIKKLNNLITSIIFVWK